MNGNPFYVQPGGDFSQGLSGLGNTVEQYGKERKAKERFSQVKEALTQAWASNDSDKIAQVMIEYPEARQTMEVLIPFRDKESKEQGLKTYRQALSLKDNPQEAINALQSRIEYLDGRGIDSTHTKSDLEALQRISSNNGDTAPVFAQMENAYSALASPQEWESYKAQSGYGASKVGAQQILPDGTVIQSTAQGPVVYSSTGERLQGADAANAVKMAQEYGVKIESAKAGGRTGASLGAELEMKPEVESRVARAKKTAEYATESANKAVDSAIAARASTSVYDDAIAAIDDGANFGTITNLLPTFRDSTKKLKNLQNQLGLGVISNTTFGALSEGEMKLAMQTAMPDNMSPEGLRKWLIDKRDAQIKLADQMEEYAVYLEGGGTKSKWMEMQKEIRSSKPADETNAATPINWSDL